MVGLLLKLWIIQGKVSPNRKIPLQIIILWYSPHSWWNRVTFLVNIHDAWWMRRSLDSPSSPPQNISLQATSPPPYPSAMCLATCTWWGRRVAASGQFLRLWPHVRVGVERFVALCFVNFVNFRDSEEYGVFRVGLSELSFFNEWNRKKISQVPLLMNTIMLKRQRLRYMFNINMDASTTN